MPYCTQCGQGVGSSNVFCAHCGGRQPDQKPPTDYLQGISSRTASLLCYIPIIGWVVSIVVLASVRFRQDAKVRFHAFQGLYLFVAWLIVDWVLSPLMSFPHYWGGPPLYKIIPTLMKVVVFGAWVFMIIKTAQDETYKLPILGELAEKSVSEQR